MKKTLAIIISFVMLLSICRVDVFADAGDLELTCGIAANGEGWSFDGSTLTLSGANISGNVIIACGGTGRNISVVTTANSTIGGDMFATFDNYSYSVNYTFTSQNNAVFTMGGGLNGGGNNYETLCVNGANVSLGGLNLGASGAADSFLVVQNGGKLTVNDSVTIQSISLSGASELTINAISSYSDSALTGNSALAFSMDDTSSIFLHGEVMAIRVENDDYDFAAFLPFLPTGTTPVVYEEFSSTLVDENGNYIAQLVMGAAAATDTTEDHKVYVKTVDSMTTPDVYSADVEWGAMEFTYTVEGSKDWNAGEHSYTDNTTASWSASGNTVTVTNHSNKVVTASFGFTKDSSITEDIGGSFSVGSKQLAAGTVGGYTTADKVVSTLTINGALDSAKTSLTKVGVVTVTIQ